MVDKQIVLNEIVEFYLSSSQFNGLPLYQMENYNYKLLCDLIDEGQIEVLSETDVNNPHIKGFEIDIPFDQQKVNISDIEKYSVLYPTPKALEYVQLDHSRPYTMLMQQGEIQFKIIYFNIEILERYNNNPQYLIMDNGYRGSICIKG